MTVYQADSTCRSNPCIYLNGQASKLWTWIRTSLYEGQRTLAKLSKGFVFRTISAPFVETAGASIFTKLAKSNISPHVISRIGTPFFLIIGASGAIHICQSTTAKATKASRLLLLFTGIGVPLLSDHLQSATLEVIAGTLGGYTALFLAGYALTFWNRNAYSQGYVPGMLRSAVSGALFNTIINTPPLSFPGNLLSVPRRVTLIAIQNFAYYSSDLWPIARKLMKGKISEGSFFCLSVQKIAERYCIQTFPKHTSTTKTESQESISRFKSHLGNFFYNQFFVPFATALSNQIQLSSPKALSSLMLSFVHVSEQCQTPQVKKMLTGILAQIRNTPSCTPKIDQLEALLTKQSRVPANKALDSAASNLLRSLSGSIDESALQELEKLETFFIGFSLLGPDEKKFLKIIARPIFNALIHNFCVIFRSDRLCCAIPASSVAA